MTTRIYPIDFYETIKPGINVSPNTFNGPGGISVGTDLRLYGQGTQDWGEYVNENFVKLAENYAGASAPADPVEGQMWYSIKQYHYNSTSQQWFRWNHSVSQWQQIDVTSASSDPVNPTMETYWYNTIAERLYRWDRRYDQSQPNWNERIYAKSDTDPSFPPSKTLAIWDGTKWNPLTAVTTSDIQPAGTTNGQMWFDTTNKRLWIYDAGLGDWLEIILTYGNSQMAGTLTLSDKRLLSVAAPVDADDVVTKQYIDNAIVNAVAGLSTDLNLHISDNTKHLTPTQNALLDGILISTAELLALKGLNVNVAQALADLTTDFTGTSGGKLDRAGGVMTGPLRIDTYVDPLDVVDKKYMDDNKRLNTMLDVAVPPGGIPLGAILKFDATTGKWVPEMPVTADGITIESSSYYTMPGETITLSARARTSDGGTLVIPTGNLTFKVNGTAISGNTYVVPIGAGATFSIDVDLNSGVTITIDGITYNESQLPSTPKTVYVATGLELTGPSAVDHNKSYTYSVKKVFSDGYKPTITGTFTWTLNGTSLGNSTGTITVPSSIPVGSRTLQATINSRSGTLNLTVSAVPQSLLISGPTTLASNATGNYTVTLTKTDGSTANVTSSSTVSVNSGSWNGATGVYTAPNHANSSTPLSVTMSASYAASGITVSDTHGISITYTPTLILNYQGWSHPLGAWRWNGESEAWAEVSTIINQMTSFGIYQNAGGTVSRGLFTGWGSDYFYITNPNGVFLLTKIFESGPPSGQYNIGRALRIKHWTDHVEFYVAANAYSDSTDWNNASSWTLWHSRGQHGNAAILAFGVYV